MTTRDGYIAGLRTLADLLDQNPDLPLPYNGSSSALLWIIGGSDQRATLSAVARAIPGVKTKGVRGDYFDVCGQIEGLRVQVIADRDQVCERVVVGTETVTREVPDPDVPMVTVTEIVEQVEWRCRPLLSPAVAS